jgi:hypothetical protein
MLPGAPSGELAAPSRTRWARRSTAARSGRRRSSHRRSRSAVPADRPRRHWSPWSDRRRRDPRDRHRCLLLGCEGRDRRVPTRRSYRPIRAPDRGRGSLRSSRYHKLSVGTPPGDRSHADLTLRAFDQRVRRLARAERAESVPAVGGDGSCPDLRGGSGILLPVRARWALSAAA